MEDYNEKLNYGSEDRPSWRDRLYISEFTYGFNLFDRKKNVNLLLAKSKESCEEGKNLLLAEKFDLFEVFKDRIKDEEIVEPNTILVRNNEYSSDYYSIPTLKDLYKVGLHILEDKFENNEFCLSTIPEELDYTYEDVDKIPESFRKDAKSKLDSHNNHIKYCKETNMMYEDVKKAVTKKDGKLAWYILRSLDNNDIEITQLIKL